MDRNEIIEHLCSKGHRGSTTENEKWAAFEIDQMLGDMGLETEVHPFRGNRTYGEKLAVHLVGAVIFSILPLWSSDLVLISSVLLVILIISFFIEATYLVEVVSRIFPKRGSQNVLGVSRTEEAERRVLFVAHYDSQKEGVIFGPKFIAFMKRFASPSSTITPIHLTFLSIVGLLVTSMAFNLYLSESLRSFHLLLHGLLILWAATSLVLMLQWALNSTYVPGANDNATGVAVMLSLAEKYSRQAINENDAAPNIEIAYLATGCEETGLSGALDFIREKKEWLEEKETMIVCLDGFGYGNIHYFTADGLLRTRPYDRELISTARSVALERFGEERGFVCRVFTDGLAFSVKGYPTITFGSLDEEKIIKNYHWRTDTPENVDHDSVEEAQGFMEAFIERIREGS